MSGWDKVQEWETAMAGEKASERFCVDCAHMATDGSLICKRPVIDLVTGKPWTLDLACHTERKSGGGCSTEGRFWKPRTVTAVTANTLVEMPVKHAEEDDGA